MFPEEHAVEYCQKKRCHGISIILYLIPDVEILSL